MNKIAAVAPFLSETSIQKIVKYLIEHGQAKKIAAIAPFMGKEMLSSQLKDINFFVSRKNEDNSCSVNSESDDLDEEGVEKDCF